MSHFFGMLRGGGSVVSRGVTKEDMLETHCTSWEGGVRCLVYNDAVTGKDKVLIELVKWRGRGKHKQLFDGFIDGSEVGE